MIVHGKAVAGIFLHDAVIVGLLQDLDPFEDRIALVDVVNALQRLCRADLITVLSRRASDKVAGMQGGILLGIDVAVLLIDVVELRGNELGGGACLGDHLLQEALGAVLGGFQIGNRNHTEIL